MKKAVEEISRRRSMLSSVDSQSQDVTLKEAVKHFGCTAFSIRRLVNADLLPAPIKKTKTTLTFSRADFLNWFKDDEETNAAFQHAIRLNPNAAKRHPDLYSAASGGQGRYNQIRYQLGIWHNEKTDRAKKAKTEKRRAGSLPKKKRKTESYLKIVWPFQRLEMMRENPICSLSEAAKALDCTVGEIQDRILDKTLKTSKGPKGGLRVDLTDELRKKQGQESPVAIRMDLELAYYTAKDNLENYPCSDRTDSKFQALKSAFEMAKQNLFNGDEDAEDELVNGHRRSMREERQRIGLDWAKRHN